MSIQACIRRAAVALLVATLAACGPDTVPAEASAAPAPMPSQPLPSAGLTLADEEFSQGAQRLGVNLPPVASWSNTPMYVDLMHQARRFGTPETPWDERALLGEDGWPVGDFGIFLMSSQGGLSTNGGVYTVRFRGQARVQLVSSRGTLGPAIYDPGSDVTTIALELPNHADQLALSFTQTRSHIKDLRVIRPGYDAANPPLFTREFLSHIQPFKVVRLMDWLRTNNHPVSRWSLRATDASVHYASEKGVPWEHAIELARVTEKDLWINIPAKADDDYVRQLAQLLHQQLPAQSRVYIEYSNEVWNSMFSQSRENLTAAVREVEEDGSSKLDLDGQRNPDVWKVRRIAQRAKEISDIFRSVYGDGAMMTRVRPVYAVQIVNTYATEIALDYMARVHGPPSRYFYAIAGAPYFNMGLAQRDENLDVDQVLSAMAESVDAMPTISRLDKNLALARWYQLPFIAYEGGADTFGPGSLRAKRAAALDPRMEGLCRRHLEQWYARGGGLFMWFHAGAGNWNTPYGTWELTTDLAITDTPKIRCMQSVLAAPKPVLRSRNTTPGRIDAIAYAGNEPPYSKGSWDALSFSRSGGHLDYLIQAPSNGWYRLVLISRARGQENRVRVSTGYGSVAGDVTLADTRMQSDGESTSVAIWLREGLNTVRLTAATVTGGFQLRQIDIRPH